MRQASAASINSSGDVKRERQHADGSKTADGVTRFSSRGGVESRHASERPPGSAGLCPRITSRSNDGPRPLKGSVKRFRHDDVRGRRKAHNWSLVRNTKLAVPTAGVAPGPREAFAWGMA